MTLRGAFRPVLDVGVSLISEGGTASKNVLFLVSEKVAELSMDEIIWEISGCKGSW